MKLYNIILYVWGMPLFLMACSSGGNSIANREGTKDTSSVVPAEDTLTYEIRAFKKFSPHFVASEERLDTTIFTASFPIFTPEINDLVKPSILVDGEDSIEQTAESFLGGYDEYAEDQLHSEMPQLHAWFKDIDCRVQFNNGKLLTLENRISEYTGGAHGIEVSIWSNYDIARKKKLTLTDVVQDTKKLQDLAEKHFRKLEHLNDTTGFEKGYFFDNNAFTLAENFGLTKEGILFYYNVYEIKPYAEGPTRLLIPYGELENILTKNGNALIRNTSTLNQTL